MPRKSKSKFFNRRNRKMPIVDLNVSTTNPQKQLIDHFESLSVTPPSSPQQPQQPSRRQSARLSQNGLEESLSTLQDSQSNNVRWLGRKRKTPSTPVIELPPPVPTTTATLTDCVMGLPGREVEFDTIKGKLTDAIHSQQGCCICVPGTGKTATVRQVIRCLQLRSALEFDFIEINGMKLTDPNQAYSVLWRYLGRRTLSGGAALRRLNEHFSSKSVQRPMYSKVDFMMIVLISYDCSVVLLDELDLLLRKKSSILYHFLEWTGMEQSQLVVLAIANTMDLPERYLPNRIASRMGNNRINFKPYLYPQLMAIIQHHLGEQYNHLFHPDAIEFCARKVSAVSGDARRALSLAKRALEWVSRQSEMLGSSRLITIPIMDQAIQQTFSGNLVQIIGDLSRRQQMLLVSIILVGRLMGSSSVPFEAVCDRFWQLESVILGKTVTSYRELQLTHLHLEQLLLTKQGSSKSTANVMASSLIKLSIPEEEVRLALKEKEDFKSILQNT